MCLILNKRHENCKAKTAQEGSPTLSAGAGNHLTSVLFGGNMNTPTRMFHTLKGLAVVGITSLGILCLSVLEGITGIALAFLCIYLAFLTSKTIHPFGR